jgi:hypothetical protein
MGLVGAVLLGLARVVCPGGTLAGTNDLFIYLAMLVSKP